MKDSIEMKYKKIIFMIVFLFISAFIINMFLRYEFSFSYLSMSLYDVEQNIEKSNLSSLVYLAIKRIEQLAVIILFMHFTKPKLVFDILIYLLSAMLGIMISVQTYYEGISGVFLLALYILPHYPVYILFLWLLRDYNVRMRFDKKQFQRIFVLTLIFLIGIMFEGIISRFFLNQFYQYMVIVKG